jgi:hypothetical protein
MSRAIGIGSIGQSGPTHGEPLLFSRVKLVGTNDTTPRGLNISLMPGQTTSWWK